MACSGALQWLALRHSNGLLWGTPTACSGHFKGLELLPLSPAAKRHVGRQGHDCPAGRRQANRGGRGTSAVSRCPASVIILMYAAVLVHAAVMILVHAAVMILEHLMRKY